MVGEFPDLQGVMGGHYALHDGESEEVAIAIAEQYGSQSTTNPSLALVVTDRIDSLVGLFAAGEAPDEVNDPYRLQRMSLILLNNLIMNKAEIDLQKCIEDAADHQSISCNAQLQHELLDFIQQNLENMLLEMGYLQVQIHATITERGNHNPFKIYQQLSQRNNEVPSDYQIS